MNLIKKLLIGLAIGLVVFAGVTFGIEVFQDPGQSAKAAEELTCNNRTVGNTATYNPFSSPLEVGSPNPLQRADGSCRDIPLLNHYNPILGSVTPTRDLSLTSGGSTAIEVYYNNGANPVGGTPITNPTASLDVTRSGNTYTIRGNLRGGNASLSSNDPRAGGDLTINVPAGSKLAYRGSTTRWFPQAIIRKELIATTGNTPDDAIADNSAAGVDSNPIFSSFAGYTFPTSNGINLSYADTNRDAVRDANTPNQLDPGFLNYGYVLLNLYVTADNQPPVLPNQTITINQGGSGDFRSYITDPTLRGTDPGGNTPLTFTTGTLTNLNGVNCVNNSTTGVVTCTADATAPLSPNRIFTVTPRNSINITGASATYTVIVVAAQTPNLTLVKSANPVSGSTVNPGQTITYTLNYANNGNANASNVVITDVLDSKLTLVPNSCTPANACTYNAANRTLTWNIGTVNAGTSGSGTFQATVNADATGTISNRGTITATGVTPIDSNIVTHTVVQLNPNLTLAKSANPASGSNVNPGQTINYTLNYSNTGQGNATNVVVTDVLDSKITLVPSSCTAANACSYNAANRTLTWNIGTVTAGTSGTRTFQATVNSDATGTISNTARITATGVNPIDSNIVTHVIVVPQPPVLPNQTITITQGGSGDFRSYITDPTFRGTDPGGNTPLTFTLGTLTGLNGVNCVNNSTSGVVTCTADANAPLTPDRTFPVTPRNSVNISGSPATYTVRVVAPNSPVLTINKASNPVNGSNVTAGQTVTYTLNFANTSTTADATGVVIRDVLDSRLTYVPNSCTPAAACSYDSATRTLTWNIGTVTRNTTGSGTFQATVNANATGNITNSATIDSNETQPVASNIVTLTIINPLTILKSTDRTTVQPGQTINYTLQYRNVGSSELTNVVITDVIDSKTTFINNSCSFNPQNSGYTCAYTDSNKTLTVNLGTLAAGANGSITFQVSVNAGATGTVINSATITSTQTGPIASNQVIIPIQGVVNPVPVLNITKTASSSIVNPNDTLTYTINFSNSGSVTATGVVITDVLDSRLTYVADSCTPANACSFNASTRTLTWNIGTLNAGASGTGTFRARVNGDATGTIPNTGSIRSDQNPNPVTSTVVVTIPTVNNGLSIAKTASSTTFNPGGTITYSIIYANNTGREATNVVLSDVLDSKLTYVDSSCSPSNQCSFDSATRTLTWRIGTLADRATGTASFQARVNGDATGTIPNTGSIRSDQNPNPVTSTVTVTINSTIQAVLTVTPKVIYVNRGPVELRITNIVDGANRPIANANCKIDLVMSDGTTASVITTSDSNGVCAATIGQAGGIFTTSGFPGASGSGNVNRLTSVLGDVRATGLVTFGNQTAVTNPDKYTVINLPSTGDTPRTGGFELITAATSGIVAMLGYLYYTNFSAKEGSKFSPKRSKEGTQN